MKNNILIVTFLLFFSSLNVFSQKKWTLEECIFYSFENNLDLVSQKISAESQKENLAQAKRNLLPGVGAGSSYGISFGRSVDPYTNDVVFNSFASNTYSLSGSLDLFRGFINANRIAYNRFIYISGMEKIEDVKIGIAFDVMSTFHNVLYYKGLLEIVSEQKELSLLNLSKVKKEVEIGISAKTDLLEIEARLADEEVLVLKTANNLKASVLELKKIMNFPVGEELEIQDLDEILVFSSPEYEDSDSVFRMAVENLPVVKAKYAQLMAVEKSLAISKGNLYPSLSMSGGYNTGYYETRRDQDGNTISFNDQFKNNASQYVNFSLSVPLFYKLSMRSQIKQSRLALEQEKVNLENYKNQLFYEIESYCQDLSASSAEYLLALKQTESNQLAFEVAEKKMEQGLFNIIDFYTSKNQLSGAKGELLRSKLQYLLKRKTIDFYLGKPVYGISIYQTEK